MSGLHAEDLSDLIYLTCIFVEFNLIKLIFIQFKVDIKLNLCFLNHLYAYII